MEKYCVSLEIAKKLKEAGWKKPVKFWWKLWKDIPSDEGHYIIVPVVNASFTDFPAPLSDEILEELPDRLDGGWLTCQKVDLWEVGYEKEPMGKSWEDNSLPNALALMFIHLKSNNLLEGGGK